jgi:hypothetical protein
VDAEWLFLRRVDQIALIAASDTRDLVKLLDLAALLRKVLFDDKSLADTVNINRVPLRFRVRALQPNIPGFGARFLYGVDVIEPTEGEVVELTRAQFGQHLIGRLPSGEVTIKDIVRYAANVAGGVHFDPQPKAKYATARQLYDAITGDDIPMSLLVLVPIGRAALRGLQPLYEDVRRRVAARSP